VNTKYFNRFIATLVGLSTPIVMLGLAQPSFAQDNAAKTRERIGVYDSRSIAIAFARSPAHEKELQQLMTEHRKAKEAGDLDKVANLEAEGKAWQEKAHKQAFSTEPVDDLLLHITNALPEIQKAAGVTVLISKWDEAALKKHARADKVDVTLQLVDAFQPNERQRKHAIEIQARKPISLERIKD
jgi:hypothetical protein